MADTPPHIPQYQPTLPDDFADTPPRAAGRTPVSEPSATSDQLTAAMRQRRTNAIANKLRREEPALQASPQAVERPSSRRLPTFSPGTVLSQGKRIYRVNAQGQPEPF